MSQSRSPTDLFGHAASDESDSGGGYDSEAAEVYKASRTSQAGRSRKRRRLSHSESDDDESELDKPLDKLKGPTEAGPGAETEEQQGDEWEEEVEPERNWSNTVENKEKRSSSSSSSRDKSKSKEKEKEKKERRPGVIYLSSIPPHLRPSALRNLLEHRGFGPVTRLFLTPITKDATKKFGSTSKARRSYAEGWVEFASHKTAKLCAQTLNATAIGGKKGSYYRDDLWNMKYLRGMGWEELMDGVRGEKREEEARRDEERRQIQRDAKIFLEGVEQGKKVEGIREKRKRKGQAVHDGEGQMKFRQFEAHKQSAVSEGVTETATVDEQARQVLSKIF